MSELDTLVAELRAAGRAAGQGGFSIDPEKAREKLRQFRLADPYRYIVLLVQAAIAAGASQVEISFDADDMRLACDCTPFDADELAQLASTIFADRGQRRGARELALGLAAAIALGPKFVRLTCGNGESGVLLEQRCDRPDVVRTHEPCTGLRIHVRERLSFGLLGRMFSARARELPEQKLLRAAALHSPVPIIVDGDRIGPGDDLVERLAECAVMDGHASIGRAGLVRTGGPGELVLLRHGMVQQVHTLDAPWAVGLAAVVDGSELTTDVALADFVRDAAYDRLLANVARARVAALDAVARASLTAPGQAPPWLDDAVREALAAHAEQPTALADAPEVVASLAAIPAWRSLAGARRSTAELAVEPRIGVCRTSFEVVPQEYGAFLLVDREVELAWLSRMFGARVDDATRRIADASRREVNRARWRARPHPPQLPRDESAYVRVPISVDDVVGELALSGGDSQSSWIRFVVDDHALCDQRVELPLPGVHVVLSGAFAPAELHDTVVPDERLVGALHATIVALHQAAVTLARRGWPAGLMRDNGRAMVELLLGACDDRMLIELLEAFSVERARTDELLARCQRPWQIDRAHIGEDNPLARVPIFETCEGTTVDLATVAHTVERTGRIAVVSQHRPKLARAPELALRVGERRVALLESLFGSAVVRAGREFEGWSARERFASDGRRSEFGLDVRGGLGPWPFMHAGMHALVGVVPEATLRGPGGDTNRRNVVVTPHIAGRTLTAVLEPCEIPGLVAAVDFPDSLMTADWNGLDTARAEPAIEALVPIAIATALAASRERIVSDEHRRWLLRVAVTAWPRKYLLRAYASFPARERMQLYAELLALFEQHPAAAVASAINDRLRAGQPPLPGSMREELPAGKKSVVWTRAPLAVLEHLPWLVELPLLATGDERGITLDALIDAVRMRRPLPYFARETPGLGADITADVLALDPEQRDILLEVFGSALVDHSDALAREAEGRAFERKVAAVPIELSRHVAWVSVSLDSDGLVGQVGLPRARPGELGGRVTVCHRGRPVSHVTPPADELACRAILDSEGFGAAQRFTSLSDDELRRVWTACSSRRAALVRAITSDWDAWPGPERELAVAWLLHLLAHELAGSHADPELASRIGVGAALALPLLRDANGRPISLADVRSSWTEHRRVPYVESTTTLASDELVLVLADATQRAAVRSIFGEIVRHADVLAARAGDERARRARAPLPSVPADALAVRSVDTHGVRGHLWLAASTDGDAEVAFGRDGRSAGCERISRMFPCEGAITGPAVEIADDWSLARVAKRASDQLKRVAYELYEEIITRVTATPQRATAAELAIVGALLLRLHRIKRAGRSWPNHDQRRLYRDLSDQPLFEVEHGRRISLTIALRERPRALAHLELWSFEDAALDDGRVAGAPAPVSSGLADPMPEPPPSPEQGLLEAIRGELRLVRADGDALLAELHLGRIHGEPRHGTTPVCWQDERVVIDTAHPCVIAAMAVDASPLLISLLASSVFTVINVALEEVSDHDEARFLLAHARLVRSGWTGAARDP